MSVFRKTKEQVRRLQELRRSNAATHVRSKKHYSRKTKHSKSRSKNGLDESLA